MRKALFLFSIFLFSAMAVIAQQKVTGKVTDASGQPLAGVSVKSKKTGKLTQTDADGSFTISVNADDELEIPFVGTADWGYLRLRREEYTKGALAGWMKRVEQQQWTDTFVFFKHEDEGTGPKLAAQFLQLSGGKTVEKSATPTPPAKQKTKRKSTTRRM